MLSSVLLSQRAIQVNIAIIRAFVRLRELLTSHKELARKLDKLEQEYDDQFRAVFEAIHQLMAPPLPENDRRIGFRLPGNGDYGTEQENRASCERLKSARRKGVATGMFFLVYLAAAFSNCFLPCLGHAER